MKTRAAILFETGKPLKIEEIEIPDLRRGQVLVRILVSGICRTQLNEINGIKGNDKFLPHLLGHEGSGIVEKVGIGVTKIKKGDYVVLSWIKSSGLDIPSCKYRQEKKIINSGSIATLTEYAVVSENRLVVLSSKIPPDIASCLGCAVPTGGGIILHDFNDYQKNSIIIFGVGGIGSSAIMVAKMAGFKKIIAVDINDHKLEYALDLGATHKINIKKENIYTSIKNISPEGIECALEATGVKSAMEQAFEIISDKGLAVIAGNLKSGEKISIDPFSLIRGKRVIGTWGGETNIDRDVALYTKAYLTGELNLEMLITERFKLGEINQALNKMQNFGSLGRMIVEFQ